MLGSPPQYLFCRFVVLQQLFVQNAAQIIIYDFGNVQIVQSGDEIIINFST